VSFFATLLLLFTKVNEIWQKKKASASGKMSHNEGESGSKHKMTQYAIEDFRDEGKHQPGSAGSLGKQRDLRLTASEE
jgi:hypothetical protein